MLAKLILVGAGIGALLGLGFCRLAYGRIPGFRWAEVMLTVCGTAGTGALAATVMCLLPPHISNGWVRFPVTVIAIAAVIWLCGDLLHSMLMRRCYSHWNSTILREADGVREGCREFAMGEGTCALVMIHGFADSPAVFQRMAPVLAERGFHCRAVRLPYHAMELEHQQRTGVADWRNAMRSELEQVNATHDRVIVVAHSMGAAIALDHVLDHAHHVDAMVMLTPLIEVSGRRSPILPPHIWYRILDATLVFTQCVSTWFAATLRDPHGNAMIKEDRFIARAIFRAMFAFLRSNRRRGHSFDKPVLMMLSHNDKTVNNGAAEAFFNKCASTIKRMVVIENTSHVVPLDTGWKRIVEEIVEFERGLPY